VYHCVDRNVFNTHMADIAATGPLVVLRRHIFLPTLSSWHSVRHGDTSSDTRLSVSSDQVLGQICSTFVVKEVQYAVVQLSRIVTLRLVDFNRGCMAPCLRSDNLQREQF
jgi:hypothetical protein